MKALRLYGVLGLGYCLWRLLFPPWILENVRFTQFWYPDTLKNRIDHHWRFSPPMQWKWDPWTRTSNYVADWGARIDYRLMAYEIVLGLVALGFLLLLCQTLQAPIRALIVCFKVEITLLRTRWRRMRSRASSQPVHYQTGEQK